jgi:hypothetical protein
MDPDDRMIRNVLARGIRPPVPNKNTLYRVMAFERLQMARLSRRIGVPVAYTMAKHHLQFARAADSVWRVRGGKLP